MAVTPNYGWPVPVATDYVKDGWEAISDLGNAIDTTVAGLGSGLTLVNATTVTAQSSVTVSNVFTSSYRAYKIHFDLTAASANSNVIFQLTASGTAATTNNYYAYTGLTETGAGSNTNGANTSSVFLFDHNSTYPWTGFKMDIIAPNATTATKLFMQNAFFNNTGTGIFRSGTGTNNNTTAYDGFKLTVASGTITGLLKVYGYED